jgi:hypothetical protein
VPGLHETVSHFGEVVAERFATGGGEPEDLLRGPFEELTKALATASGSTGVVLAGEHHLADERVRPDYAVFVRGALTGFVEIKAPGKGVDPSRFRGHDRRQWDRLACLPNVLYTDGQSFALFRDGERVGQAVHLVGPVESAGRHLSVTDNALEDLFARFLNWAPVAPRRPRELARATARLCRLLRSEVEELLVSETGLRDLATDWRRLLYPDATDAEFADGYAQTVTFALLLARVEGISLADRDLREVSDDLGANHTLMARALAVLTDPGILPKLAVSVRTLQRVLSIVDWEKLSESDPAAWLYFYEEFLDGYDPALRRATGSYYTPVEAVDPMVRMVEDLLRSRLDRPDGFASSDVTVVDPAVGTGTFLFRIVERIARWVEAEEGLGAVGPRLRAAATRLVGFEMQAGPYSVAELRLSTEFQTRGASLGADELRLYLTDTLSNPFVEDEQLAATYRPIALSRQRANRVKREDPVLVVIGNPPYRERSHGRGGWIEAGSAGGSEGPPIEAFLPPPEWNLGRYSRHLYNPYVYFWRWATWKVFENHPADKGIVAFVTVAGFLSGPGFAAMRAYLRETADSVWVIDCSPEGHQPDVSTRLFAGVQQPLCITVVLRDRTTGADEPAAVHFTSIGGTRTQKFSQLAALDLEGSDWIDCPDDWRAPFLPGGSEGWNAYPALEELLGWSGTGTMIGRTWPVAPTREVLQTRWNRLVAAPLKEKPALLAEHKRDRTIHTQLSDNLPGRPAATTIAAETGTTPAPVRYGYRSFDLAWILPDKRLINRPNPGLWQVRMAPGQVFLTGLGDRAPESGPAVTFTAHVPDVHHFHGRGGRAWPLFLDASGSQPNIAPGLLAYLGELYERDVGGPDLFAYLAAVVAHPGYLARYRDELSSPGLRIPLTTSSELFFRAVEVGRRVVWLHTFGQRFVDAAAVRPAGPPRAPAPQRPRVVDTIPDTESRMPDTIEFDVATSSLHVGEGRIAPVAEAVWEYDVSGYRVLRRWFGRRKREPEGRRSSPLDDVVARSWDPAWTTELLDVINVLTLLVEREPEQALLLEEIAASTVVTVADLRASGVLPQQVRVLPERPVRQSQL